MAPRSQSECIRQIRRSLEQGEYGRYDLVPELFPLPLLLSERPRQLRRLLAQRLGVPLEKVRYKTFVSWLARYRARVRSEEQMAAETPTEEVRGRREGEGDWKSFTPSVPKRSEEDGGTLLGFPSYE